MFPTLFGEKMRKVILIASALTVAASPAIAALSGNALTSNALAGNALAGNSLTTNSLSSNSTASRNTSIVVTGETIRAISLPSGERVVLR
jgi:uncharacterized protein YdeI (BOF family)